LRLNTIGLVSYTLLQAGLIRNGRDFYSSRFDGWGILGPGQGISKRLISGLDLRSSSQLISCLLISYPLGSLFIRIPSSQPGLKHIFNLTVTLVYLLPVLNMYSALLQLLGSVMGTYMIAANVRGPRMPWIVFVYV